VEHNQDITYPQKKPRHAHQTLNMTNGSPYSGIFLCKVDVLFMLSPFPSLEKKVVHYDLSKYDGWLSGRIGYGKRLHIFNPHG
jgi:hypothetical protein